VIKTTVAAAIQEAAVVIEIIPPVLHAQVPRPSMRQTIRITKVRERQVQVRFR
jgi:hypothetical protein